MTISANSMDGPAGGLHGMQIRDAAPAERRAALQLALRWSSAALEPSDRTIDDFLHYLAIQGLDVTWVLAVTEEDRLRGACLGIVSPGRTVMVMPSACGAEDPLCTALSSALRELQCRAQAMGSVLLQALTDDRTLGPARALQGAGYSFLADLRYMSVAVEDHHGRRSEKRLSFEPYDAEHHALFREVLGRTYIASLDCPALVGCRSVDDIIATHKATGMHDPDLWLLARAAGEPIGVLLLTRTPLRPAMEIVYVGVVPEARGRGFGRELVEAGVQRARAARCTHLLLAVDQRNRYALEAYRSAGFSETDRRFAWFRALRRSTPSG